MNIANVGRLLIVDDDPHLLDAYTLFFEAHDYEIRTARDGIDALAAYSEWRPETVVLDIQMPRLDGRAVAREIRRLKARPAPLLVAVTALSSLSDRAESIRSGFDHLFVKPAELPAILVAIAARPRHSDAKN